ncbi:MAG: SMI1/KNR4 family protein [Planctomycetia bacterium]|nr:SMI1/KNR4 family protein [Planctomycetia bacterium]
MAESMWSDLIGILRDKGIDFDVGLTDAEVNSAEARYGFRFPPDLRALLQAGLPRGRKFPDWRHGDETALRDWLDRPRQGVVFDIEHNSFWLEEWGPRPKALAEARLAVERLVQAAPVLIPVYQHRMMPADPHLPGNPVFSVHQTDIIVYGRDLWDYLVHEFLMSEEEQWDWTVPTGTRPIRFWDTDRFQAVRWGPDGNGGCVFDNSRGQLP